MISTIPLITDDYTKLIDRSKSITVNGIPYYAANVNAVNSFITQYYDVQPIGIDFNFTDEASVTLDESVIPPFAFCLNDNYYINALIFEHGDLSVEKVIIISVELINNKYEVSGIYKFDIENEEIPFKAVVDKTSPNGTIQFVLYKFE